MSQLKVIALAGSTRKDSYNKVLIRRAVQAAEAAGAQVTLVDLADFPMPFYDGDLEAESGLPEKAAELKRLMNEAQAFIISSAEYNASIPAVLKNAIDWTSRPGAVEGSVYAHKPILFLSASPGALGGMRGLNHLRDVVTNLGMFSYNRTHSVSAAHQAFGPQGDFQDPEGGQKLDALVSDYLGWAKRHLPHPVHA